MPSNDDKKVLVVGLGYVGLTLAVHLARHGLYVHGVEINPEILGALAAKKAPFYEPGIDAYFAKHLDENLFISESVPKGAFDFAIISVGTPLIKKTKQADFSYLNRALQSLRPILTRKTHVILRSTVNVGATRHLVAPLLKEWTGADDESLLLSFCPERTAEGKALEELNSLVQLVSGYNEASRKSSTEFFSSFSRETLVCPSLEAAELAKLFNNVYRDINFSIGNLFNRISQSFGIDGLEMIRLANRGYERSQIALPGFVGGACLEKDPYILASNTSPNIEKLQILSHRQYNEDMSKDVCDWVSHRLKPGSFILVSGLAFKGKPKTSDLRGSLGVEIVNLLKKDYEITVHDFSASRKHLEGIGGVRVADELPANSKDYALLLILNNAVEYSHWSVSDLKSCLAPGAAIFDSWSCLPKEANESFKVYTLGNYRIET